MPTATGLPKAGDQVYNDHFKQRFRVMGRSSNSYPLTIYIRPMPGKDFPADMIRARRRMPDGTLPLPVEVPIDDAFRVGLSHWTNLPDQGEIEPGRIVRCTREDIHAAHLYIRGRVWHKCLGRVRSPKPGSLTPEQAEDAIERYKANRDAGMTEQQKAHRAAGTTRGLERRIRLFLEDTEATDPATRLAAAEGLLGEARRALRRTRSQ